MGNCLSCSRTSGAYSTKIVNKPEPWTHPKSITRAELNMLRQEFWAEPKQCGRTVIWEALHAAAESELPVAQIIIEANGIFNQFNDLRSCYDDEGDKYELPFYCLSEPTNLIPDNQG